MKARCLADVNLFNGVFQITNKHYAIIKFKNKLTRQLIGVLSDIQNEKSKCIALRIKKQKKNTTKFIFCAQYETPCTYIT